MFYSYRHGNCRHAGIRGLVEIMFIVKTTTGPFGLGFAHRRGSGWCTRYLFIRDWRLTTIGWAA